MATIEEMNNWNYAKAWEFFSENASNRLIPETAMYLRDLNVCFTEDLRENKEARKKILEALKKKSLVLIDGSSLNGKTTFANRLSKHINANVVDIDMICKDWIDQQLAKDTNPIKRAYFWLNVNRLTDIYILENLENIIKKESQYGNVILVGSYMEVIYRAIIVKTLGQYFDQVVSIYCCAKSFDDVIEMKKARDIQFGFSAQAEDQIKKEYLYSKKLLQEKGFMLSFGMSASFIADKTVSNMFV